jgi:hypothetical protein
LRYDNNNNSSITTTTTNNNNNNTTICNSMPKDSRCLRLRYRSSTSSTLQ